MSIDRRQFTKVAGVGVAALGVAWQQACVQVAETGEVSAETVRALLDAQAASPSCDTTMAHPMGISRMTPVADPKLAS